MKVAIVHDWLTGMRGGENVLEKICEIYPDAPLYTLIHIPGSVSAIIEKRKIYTSQLQYFPFAKNKYRHFLPLMPFFMSLLNFKEYDLVVSVSHCVAKNAKVNKRAVHICYCNTPMRYIWDMFDDYFSLKRSKSIYIAMLIFRPVLRLVDVFTSRNVTHFIGNSKTVKQRINSYYKREAEVIYPPVDTEFYSHTDIAREDYYLVASSLVPYKRIDLAVEAFNRTKRRLVIIGVGPELEYLKKIAADNIEFLGWGSKEVLRDHYRKCRALIFPGKEDFGIVPVEAMSCGAPVICFGSGGATETVVDRETGIYFPEQTAGSLNKAITELENYVFETEKIIGRARMFSENIFVEKLKQFIMEKSHALNNNTGI